MQPAVPNRPPRRVEWVVWSGLALTVATIVVAFVLSRIDRARRHSAGNLPVLFADLPSFSLTNQAGRTFASAELAGKVWFANIIFTRCGGPCPEMTARMAALQAELPAVAGLRFITLTTDPEFDTPPVLAAYGRRFHADPERWQFLTGTKAEIGHVVIDGFRLVATEKSQAERENDRDLFVHSTRFVLVDKRMRVRAAFESDDPDMKTKAIAAAKALLEEPNR